MELNKISLDEMRSFEQQRLQEVENTIRKEIMNLRMDVFTEKGKNSGAKKALRKQLARILTIQNQKKNKNS